MNCYLQTFLTIQAGLLVMNAPPGYCESGRQPLSHFDWEAFFLGPLSVFASGIDWSWPGKGGEPMKAVLCICRHCGNPADVIHGSGVPMMCRGIEIRCP